MKVLHITDNGEGYEEVELLANRVNRKNHLHVIEKYGEQFFTGGFILNITPMIRGLLDALPKEEQYDFVYSFRMEPFVKPYFEED